jgi:hypothetical protein
VGARRWDKFTTVDTSLFDRFRPVFESDAAPEAQDPRLLIDSDTDQGIAIYYSPFDYVAPSPRLVLLGVTPGSEQAEQANHALWQELRQGTTVGDSLRSAKLAGAFRTEPLRTNLLRQLEDWRVHEWLGLDSPEDILTTAQEQGTVHVTSSLRYPTFKAGKVYGGGTPKILDKGLLRRHFIDYLCSETPLWGDAVVLPLGKEAVMVSDALTARGALRRENVYPGLMNPSKNNLYRLEWILGDRTEKRPSLTDPASYDTGRERFRRARLES